MKYLLNFRLFESANDFIPKKDDNITNFPAYKKLEDLFTNVTSDPEWTNNMRNKNISVGGLGYSFSVSPKKIIFYGSFNICNVNKNPEVFTSWDNILKFITSYAIGMKLKINSNLLQPFYNGIKVIPTDTYVMLKEHPKFYDFIVNNALDVNPSFKEKLDKLEMMANENISDPLAIGNTDAFKYLSKFYDIYITPSLGSKYDTSLISIRISPIGAIDFSHEVESNMEYEQKWYKDQINNEEVSSGNYFTTSYSMSPRRGFNKENNSIGAKDNKTLEKYTWDLFGSILDKKNLKLSSYSNRSSDELDKILADAYSDLDKKIMNKDLDPTEMYSDSNVIIKNYIKDLFSKDLVKYGVVSHSILTQTENQELKDFVKSFKNSKPLITAGHGINRITQFDDDDNDDY